MSKNTHEEAVLHQEGKNISILEEYLGEFVYGGIDGCVTTFAVVAGAVGAQENRVLGSREYARRRTRRNTNDI